MWVSKAFMCLYLSATVAAQESDGAPPVPCARLLSQWPEVFPSERVVLGCDIDGGPWTVAWSRDGREVLTTGAAAVLSEDTLSLTLKVEGKEQSGKYSCKGFLKTNTSHSTPESSAISITVKETLVPALTTSVGLPVDRLDIFVGESVTFTCQVGASSSWEYVWFLNGDRVHKSPEGSYAIASADDSNNGKYHCRVQRGGADVSTDSNTVAVSVSVVPKPNLKLLSRWSEVIEKERVLLGCETVGTDWSFTWFKDGEPLSKSPDVSVSADGRARLTISSVSRSLQGAYTCRAYHDAKHVSSGLSQPCRINVHDTPTPTLFKSPPLKRLFVGERVNFSCTVDVSSDWTYKWYKDGALTGTGPALSVRLGLSDAGKYSCQALRTDGAETRLSETMTQTVDEVLPPSVKLLSKWSHVYVDEAVTLGCEAGSTDWSFAWFKNGQPLSGDVPLSITEQGASLHIASASLSHAGAYSCRADHKTRAVHSEASKPLDVKVHESTPKPTLSQQESGVNPMFVGETVRFSCSVAVDEGWTFIWFKDGTNIGHHKSSIEIPLGPTDGGSYSCKATRGGKTTTVSSDSISLTVHEIPILKLKALTPWRDLFPSETAMLGCGGVSLTPSDWTYEWHRDEQRIPPGTYGVSSDSDGPTLNIGFAASSHRGQYKCRARLKGRQVVTSFSAALTLDVYDHKPRPILVQDPDYSVLFPQEPLSLQCRINISVGWGFVWYKNGERLQFNQSKYEVASPDSTHSGSYTCEARRGSLGSDPSQVKNVEIRAHAPAPVLSQVPDVDTVYVREQLTLRCSLHESVGWEYKWYKDEQIIESYVSSINVSATQPHIEVYRCEAKRKKTLFNARSQPKVITIAAVPTPTLENLTHWLDVFPGETLSLSCGMETKASDWLYRWSKDGQPVIFEERMKSDLDGTSLTLIASEADSGNYSCMARHKERPVVSNYSSEIRLKVYGSRPGVELVQDPEVGVFHTEDSVSFRCRVEVSSGWEYSWHRHNRPVGSGPNYTIAPLDTSHSGEYECKARRGRGETLFHADPSRTVTVTVEGRPSAAILLKTGWSDVFSTDRLVLGCEAKDTKDADWEFKWFIGGKEIAQNLSAEHVITPQNDPDQSAYMCQGVRTGRPSYTRRSEPLETKNLLVKRRVLLSISGCLVFGICAVFIGCIVLRISRKKVEDNEKTEEPDLFLSMAELVKHAPNPLAEYVTDEDIAKVPSDANGDICSESTPLTSLPKDDDATPSQSNGAPGNNEMTSFKQ